MLSVQQQRGRMAAERRRLLLDPATLFQTHLPRIQKKHHQHAQKHHRHQLPPQTQPFPTTIHTTLQTAPHRVRPQRTRTQPKLKITQRQQQRYHPQYLFHHRLHSHQHEGRLDPSLSLSTRALRHPRRSQKRYHTHHPSHNIKHKHGRQTGQPQICSQSSQTSIKEHRQYP